ncbi:MAG: holo-ACP synthase [Saprospiraceae bacterium]|nr:holo-ACP synthase [Saprospiraceae bacterium]
MIWGIGIDIIEVERVAQKVDKPGFKERVFTEKEIAYCDTFHLRAERYAARFAAKEAFFKAMGTGWMGSFSFNEVEIVHNPAGKPEIVLHGEVKQFAAEQAFVNIQLSMSHIKETAAAFVIIEKK